MTATIVYKGDFRCECTHLQSGTVIETDAPTDNQGKGERFSPTDSVCVALGTCIITTMAIKAKPMQIELKGTQMNISKHMVADPRRIGKIEVNLQFPENLTLVQKDRDYLQSIGDNCPVMKSLNTEIEVIVQYNW